MQFIAKFFNLCLLKATVDLLEPYFLPVLEELLEDVQAGRFSLQENIRKITQQWLEVSPCIPASFFQLCEMLESMVSIVCHHWPDHAI